MVLAKILLSEIVGLKRIGFSKGAEIGAVGVDSSIGSLRPKVGVGETRMACVGML
jgi:hypothetical protein